MVFQGFTFSLNHYPMTSVLLLLLPEIFPRMSILLMIWNTLHIFISLYFEIIVNRVDPSSLYPRICVVNEQTINFNLASYLL